MKRHKITLCALLVVICVLTFTACGNSKVTLENYNRITCATLNLSTGLYEGGMMLYQVKNILGEPDASVSTTVMGVATTIYTWGNEEKGIEVSFVNERVIAKAQIGLK